jgi:nucleotide-binding universal stress UspA family protein
MYPEVGAWSGRTYPPGAVVVGFDDTEHSRAAVAWAAEAAVRHDVPLVVLHAANYPGLTGPPGTGLYHRDPGALEAAEEVTGRGVAEALAHRPGLSVVGATEVTSATTALVAASREAALVVVGTRGRGNLASLLLGSTSRAVAQRAHQTVAVVQVSRHPSYVVRTPPRALRARVRRAWASSTG